MSITKNCSAIVYSSETCPWCNRAKILLEMTGIQYEEVSQKHPDWPTYPAIVIDGNLIGGFSELADYVRS